MEVMTETDLDWAVIVEGESAEEWSCERGGVCDREAVLKVLWMPEDENDEGDKIDPCSCGPHSYLMCALCFDLLSGKNGLVWCGRCSTQAAMQFKTLVHSEPIRRFS